MDAASRPCHAATARQPRFTSSRRSGMTRLSLALKVTLFGLVGAMIGIWIQSISGVPDYGSRFPPGPFVLGAIAGVLWLGGRLWWTPLIGAGVCLLITIGAFV